MRIPGGDEIVATEYGTLKPDEYRVRIDSFSKHNDKTQYNEDGHDNYRIRLYPEAYADDEDTLMEMVDGSPVPEDKYVVLFFDPNHLGTKPMVSKGRQFLSAVVGVPSDAPVEFPEFDTWDEVLESFIGRKVIVGLTAKNGNNQVAAVRPMPKKRGRTSIVEAARATFGDDAKPAPDDDLPF